MKQSKLFLLSLFWITGMLLSLNCVTAQKKKNLPEKNKITNAQVKAQVKTSDVEVPVIVNTPGDGRTEDVTIPKHVNSTTRNKTSDIQPPVVINKPGNGKSADVELPKIINKPGNGKSEDVELPVIVNKAGNAKTDDVTVNPEIAATHQIQTEHFSPIGINDAGIVPPSASVALVTTGVPCFFSGRITITDPTMSSRLLRDAIPSTCNAPKTYPGFGANGTFYYDDYSLTNTTGTPQCVTVNVSTTDPAQQVHVVAYYNSFDPNNISANYAGDCGSSASTGSPQSFAVNVANNVRLVLVAFDPSSGNVMTQNYIISVNGLPCPEVCNYTGRIVPGPTMTNRILRDAVSSRCSVAKTFPGISGGTFYYNTFYIPNNTGNEQCVSITTSTSDPAQQVHVTAYLNSYDPANLATNYLGDCGSSAVLNSPQVFKVNVPAGATLVLLVVDPTSGNTMTQDYNIAITGLPCPPSCTATGRITSTLPLMTNRIFRDAVPSQCASTKVFPGTSGGSYYYESYNYPNTTGTTQCVTITAATTDPTQQVHVTAYLNSFSTSNLATNYLGDCGSSASINDPKTFKVNVPAGATLVLLVINPSSGNVMTQNYTINITGLSCPSACTKTGRITTALPLTTNRIFRNAIAAQCGNNKPFPGISGGSYYYTSYYYPNTTGIEQCVSITTSTTDPSQQVHVTAYLNAYDLTDLSTNYLGDCGSSASLNDPKTFKVNVPAGATLVLLVINPTSGNVMTQDFSISVTGLSCPPSCGYVGRITTSLPLTSSRIFRDAIASQCGSTKTFPGSSSGIYYYNSHYIPNSTGSEQCVSVTVSTTDPTQQVHLTAYLNSYDLSNLSTNYLGDCGSSASLNDPKTFKVNVPAGATLVLLVIDPTSGNVMTQDYVISISGLPCPPQCTALDRITNSLPIATSRVFRDAIASQCSSAKAFPGTSGGTYYYKTHEYPNTTGSAQCVTITTSTSDPIQQVHVTAYLNSFDPGNLATNYLGDCGSSASLNDPKTFKVNVPAGATLVLVAIDPTSGNVMTQDYFIQISGLPCPPECSITDRVKTNSLQSTNRIFRDAIISQCSSAKTFPGVSGGIYYYNRHFYQNNTGGATCVTIKVSTTDPVQQVHVTAYLNSFDPTNLATNYLGDCGSSASLNDPKSFKVNVPNGATMILVATDPASGNTMTQDYTIHVTGIDCSSYNSTVTINQAGTQTDPTPDSPIHFTVTFSEDVSGFTGGDVVLSGTAGATTAVVTGGPRVYNVAVSGMTTSGTVIANVPFGVVTNSTSGGTNAASTSADNTVTYNPLPCVITCPANITVNAGANSCTAIVNYPAPAISGGCGTVTATPASGSAFPIGTTTVNVVSTTGNTCSFTVTVTDNQPPVITCPSAITVSCASAVPAPNTALITATDNCGTPTITFVSDVITNQTCANRYTITRTYRATDAADNSATCLQTITVNDQTVPVITCPAPVTVSCSANVPSPDISLVSATDGCGGVVTITFVNDVISAQTCTNKYTITRTYRATDACGNNATCAQIITVNDNIAPTITSCPAPVTVSCASAVLAPNTSLVTATDNCSGAVTISFVNDVISAQTCANKYTITRTYSATDICGNSATCTQTITVNDDIVPTITSCPAPVTVSCASTVPAPNTSLVTATDNCSGAVTISFVNDVISAQTCANKYTITRTYRAADACGNNATCTQTITVNDQTAPVITCPSNITVNASPGTCSATVNFNVTATDNCSGAITIVSSPASGSIFNTGTTTVTSTATDACGNRSTCTFTVTVNDAQPPVITTQPVNKAICAGGTTSLNVTATNAVSYQWQQFNGSSWLNIPGATASSYIVTNATGSMTGTYRVTVNGLCSTVISNQVLLTVYSLPSILLSASPGTSILPNQTTIITATTSPSGGQYSWLWNGSAISTTSSPALGPLNIDRTGDYRVVYTDPNGCSNTSHIITIKPEASDDLWVYPNPNSGRFNVRYYNQNGERALLMIYNSLGQRIYSTNLLLGATYTNTEVNLGFAAAGVYFVKVISLNGRELAVKRLIILHP